MGMGSFGSGSPTRTQHQLSSSFAGDSVIEGNLLIAGTLGVSGSFGLGTPTPSVGSTKGLDIENTTASSNKARETKETKKNIKKYSRMRVRDI